MDIGIQNSIGKEVVNPLPISWIGRADMPPALPAWANIDRLSTTQVVNLQAQIAYNKSFWDYNKIGENNELGRYQFSTTTLEEYGILAVGSNDAYDTDCVNYTMCWRPVVVRKNTSSYANYIYDVDSLTSFLNHTTGQDQIAFQITFDFYNALVLNNAITATDTPEIIAGMIAVAWELGAGAEPSYGNPTGTGAYAWRYHDVGSGADAYNNGRYAITVLSQ